MHQFPLPNSPLTRIRSHPGISARISLFLKRDDLLHPAIHGNKWRKLEPLLPLIQQGEYTGILTFGGPLSNHIHAVAAAGRLYGFPAAAIVRGQAADLSNPTLAFARTCGMQIFPVSKKDYDAGMEIAAVRQIIADFPNYFHLPEGGSTPAAARNCMRISREILDQLDGDANAPLFIAIPAGTGCTAAGVIAGLGNAGTALVFPAAPYGVDEASVRAKMAEIMPGQAPDFRVISDYSRHGFAAYRPEWIDFALDFYQENGVLLDPIYTVKMMFGLLYLLGKGYFPERSTVVAVHTGGLQGWAGFNSMYRQFKK